MVHARTSFSGLSVDDLHAARDFYVTTLGLKLLDDSMGLSLELPGGGQLFIYEKVDHEPASFTVLNLVVENINDAIDELVRDHSVKFERYDNLPAEQDARGVLRGKAGGMGPDIAWFTDPAGNIIALVEE